MLTLLASAARTASGDSGALGKPLHPEIIKSVSLLLDVTAAATDVDDTLNVFLQTFRNGQWDDFVHFTEILGNGGVKKFITEWFRGVAPESEQHAPQDVALAAGVDQGGKLGTDLRVKWVVVDPGGGAASFTFSVSGEFVSERQ